MDFIGKSVAGELAEESVMEAPQEMIPVEGSTNIPTEVIQEEPTVLSFQFRNDNPMHFYQATRDSDRAKAFGNKSSKEIIKECLSKLMANQEVAVIKDTRKKDSNQVRIFKTEAGGLVAIPCYERDDGKIDIITLLNVYEAKSSNSLGCNEYGGQYWFVKNYNEFAKAKGLNMTTYHL